MKKIDRILLILYKAMLGEKIVVSELANEYQVSTKSVLRDISEVRSFLAENPSITGDMKLEYDRNTHSYQLRCEDVLSEKELLLLVKILFGSRALDEESLHDYVRKLSRYHSQSEKEFFNTLCKNEMEYYRPIQLNEEEKLMDYIWELESVVRRGKVLKITYERLDGQVVERTLYPIAVAFSGFYFYLLACRDDKKDMAIVYYRVDRIREMEELKERIPIDIKGRRELENAKLYNQKMFMGNKTKIRFRYTGPSLDAILDKFPTAEVVRQDSEGTELVAWVEYSRGTIMELLSQGRWIRVLGPYQLIQDTKNELKRMYDFYKEECS